MDRISNDHMRNGIVSTEVQADFHSGIPTPDDQDFLVSELGTGLVAAGVNNPPVKPLGSGNLRHQRLGVLTGGGDEPPRKVLESGGGPNCPEGGVGVEVGGDDGPIEEGVEVEAGSVGFQVGDELVFGRVLGEVFGESEKGELAEVLGEVEFEAVVSPVLPQRGYAVASLNDQRRNALFGEARRDS